MAIRKKGAPPTQTAHEVNEQAAILEREKKALHLKKSGASYRAIGDQLNISHTQARFDVANAMSYIRDDVAVDAKALRDIEVARLDDDLLKLQDYINGERVIVRDANGNPLQKEDGSLIYDVKRYPAATVMAAIDRKIRIGERRSKLLGLDAPVRQDITTDGKPLVTEDARDQLERILASRIERNRTAGDHTPTDTGSG